MTKKYDAAIIGGDLRQYYLSNILQEQGYKIITFGVVSKNYIYYPDISISAEQAIMSSNTLIMPVPFTKDKKYIFGLEENNFENNCKLSIENFLALINKNHYLIAGNIPKEVIENCNNKEISYFDLMKCDDIALLNAIATAEGAISEAIIKSSENLHQSKCLVLGYGKCGKLLATKLSALGAKVTVAARRKEALVEAYTNGFDGIKLYEDKFEIQNYNYIFNTIPARIINKEDMISIKSDTTIIDISSPPGGFDFELAKELNLNAHLCPGIPGKTAPKASAKILTERIIPILNERSD